MSKKGAKIKIDEYKGPLGSIKGFELTTGNLSYGDETEWEPMGPHPKPHIPTLRSWFFKLMERYKPFYMPICDMCCLCTYGKCNLSKGRTGACGINMETQQARIVEIACCIGASCHSAHGDHLLHWLKEKYGNIPIDFGNNIAVEMPMTRMIVGMKPETLEDLESAMDYVHFTITHLLAAAHTGQESSYLDYEAKSFLAGLADAVGMEISDAVQIAAYGFPVGDPDVPVVELGMGTMDTSKATILMIGHNVAPGIELVDYIREKGIDKDLDVGAICCTAHDLTRYYDGAKIVGSMSRQMHFIRSGLADVVMVDEQCVNLRSFEQAQSVGAAFIATNEKNMSGLTDRTNDPVEQIVDDLVSGKEAGVLILDPVKAGAVAAETAIKIHPIRQSKSGIPDEQGCIDMAYRCNGCANCQRNCPNDLPLVEAINLAKEGDFSILADPCFDLCLGCGRCEAECMKEVSPLTLIQYAGRERIRTETFNCRVGRGPIQDTEIRNVGAPIVLGEIPGIIAIIGCANYGKDIQELYLLAEEFCRRNYIVVVSGCAAMDIGLVKDEDGKTLYDRYTGDFDRGGLVNVGSCVANPHIIGAACKVANIFARRPLRGNFEEIADYILNRVGAVGVAWGAMSQKAASIASMANGVGIPAVVGPHSAEYRRMYIGRSDDEDSWKVWNARDGTPDHVVGPGPEHLLTTAETIEQAVCLVAKLCLRPADNSKGRMIKLSHWLDLERKYKGVDLPEDLYKYIRVEADIPINMKTEIQEYLKEKDWKPKEIIDPTLLQRMCHT